MINCMEANLRREVREEAGIDVTEPKYVGSAMIDDWRYSEEADKIVTMFYETTYLSGHPEPADDIVELRWMKVSEVGAKIVPEHLPLYKMLRKRTAFGRRDLVSD